jgi:hypothetical protein
MMKAHLGFKFTLSSEICLNILHQSSTRLNAEYNTHYFFSRTRRRVVYHYIKKLKGERSPVQQKLLQTNHLKQQRNDQNQKDPRLSTWCSHSLEKGQALSSSHGPQQGLLPGHLE